MKHEGLIFKCLIGLPAKAGSVVNVNSIKGFLRF